MNNIARYFPKVTPGTERKSNKRPVEQMSKHHPDDNDGEESMEQTPKHHYYQHDDEEEEDLRLDLDLDDMKGFTQVYCTQGDIFEEEESDEEEKDAEAIDFTQEEVAIDDIQVPDESVPQRRESFHQDTDYQVSIDVDNNIRRIFKLGESFTSNVNIAWLCKKNKVPAKVKVTDVIYTIQQFQTVGMKKMAKCKVFIPLYQTVPDDHERNKVQKQAPNTYVTLRYSELIELRKLVKLVPEDQVPGNDSLVYSVDLDSGHMSLKYEIAYEEEKGAKKAFLMLDDIPNQRPIVLDLFAGGGGMATGFSDQGFDDKYMVESDPQAAATLKLNHPKATVYEERVENFLAKAKAGNRCYPTPQDVHHVHASSPCQGTFERKRSRAILVF